MFRATSLLIGSDILQAIWPFSREENISELLKLMKQKGEG